MKTISAQALDRLRNIDARRQESARLLGGAAVEYELGKARAYAEHSVDTRKLHETLGALVFRFDMFRVTQMQRIETFDQQQRETGTHALREAGCNPDADELTILMDTGEIRLMNAGAWAEVE